MLLALIRLLRYRFFVWAGLLPYLLGTAAVRYHLSYFSLRVFLLGLAGIVLALVAVEAFNESFESGTDTLFSVESWRQAPRWMFPLALISLAVAGCIGLYLTQARGLPILGFAFLGAMAAAFYVGPPIRWAYRGLGETVIALSYGPLMICGAWYLQACSLSAVPLLVSIAPALFISALAVANELPDFHQDSLVGKRNLTVRLGRPKAARLFACLLGLAYAALALATIAHALPPLSWLFFLTLPGAILAARAAILNCDSPQEVLPAIRAAMFLFALCNLLLAAIFFVA